MAHVPARPAGLSRRALLAAPALLAARPSRAAEEVVLRVGHFPNITHVQGLVAHALTRQGKGWFEQRLGAGTRIDWFVYNAGPSAMEAVFAGSIDLTYVGPSPALNAYARSRGEEVRIVAGAANGGAALVVQPDEKLTKPEDFRGKKIATPQLGNTQDVSARAWLTAGGLRIRQNGGDAFVIPTANPDQLALFKRHDLDAVWTVEPWVSRLELEAGAVSVYEERDAITTVLVSATAFLEKHRDLVRRFVAAHRELTAWIVAHPDEAREIVRAELSEETHSEVKAALIAHAWPRITLTDTVERAALEDWVARAKAAGFLRDVPDLSRLVVTS